MLRARLRPCRGAGDDCGSALTVQRSSFVFLSNSWTSSKTEHSAVGLGISARFCKIVECAFSNLDDMTRNERGALLGALVAALDTAFPFQHRPSFKIVLRQLGEDAAKVHLTVSQRPEAARASNPGLIPAIDSLAAARPELGVLHVEHFDSAVIDIDEL